MKVIMAENLLKVNKNLANTNRKKFNEEQILTVNLISSPGAGKTTLLERTLKFLKNKYSIGVIEGDLSTTNDAKRIEAHGVRVVQINTSGGCHLDANMVSHAMNDLPLHDLDIVFIENVGNLVCPASFDLGEDFKVVVLSVTEGDDKPVKYPTIFRESKAVILNKLDLTPYTDFNLESAERQIQNINGNINIFKLSAKTEEGLEEWIKWLEKEINLKREALKK